MKKLLISLILLLGVYICGVHLTSIAWATNNRAAAERRVRLAFNLENRALTRTLKLNRFGERYYLSSNQQRRIERLTVQLCDFPTVPALEEVELAKEADNIFEEFTHSRQSRDWSRYEDVKRRLESKIEETNEILTTMTLGIKRALRFEVEIRVFTPRRT